MLHEKLLWRRDGFSLSRLVKSFVQFCIIELSILELLLQSLNYMKYWINKADDSVISYVKDKYGIFSSASILKL